LVGRAPAGSEPSRDGGGNIRRWVRDASVYGTASVLVQVVGVLGVPLFSRAFSTAQYGVMDAASILVSLGTLMVLLGIPYGLQREYLEAATRGTAGRLMSTCLAAVLITSAALATPIIVASPMLSGALFHTATWASALAWAAVGLPFGVIWATLSVVVQLQHRPTIYGIAAVAGAVVNFASSLLLVLVFKAGLPGFFAGTAAGAAVSAGTVAVALRRDFGPPAGFRLMRPVVAFGLPILPASLLTWAQSYANRFVVLGLGDASMMGILGIGVRISMLLSLIVSAVASAWNPQVMRLHVEDPAAEADFRAKATSLYAYFLAVVGLLVMMLAREIVAIAAPPTYSLAAQAAPLLIASVFATGLAGLLGTGISLARKSAHYAWAALIAVTANLLVTAALLRPVGVVAAAIGAACGSVAMLLYQAWQGHALAPAPLAWRRIVVSTVAVFTAAISLTVLYTAPILLRVGVSLAAIAAMSFAVDGAAADWRNVFERVRAVVSGVASR
jgi:O-antigen/teichoic acid export membrane protein